jgi:hypothetical protein
MRINANVMSSRFSDIIQYFKTIASQHVEIGHSEQEKHFYRYEIEEVLTGLKQINYPALILEGYRYSFQDNGSDNIIKKRSGAFILLDHLSDIGDYDAMHALWDKQEEICDDILARIKSDKFNPQARAIRDFDINSTEVSLLANEQDKNFGIRCTFTISSPRHMNPDPSKWNLTS